MKIDKLNMLSPNQISDDDDIYRYLSLFYLDDLSDPYLISEIDKPPNPRRTISQYVASWLPYEKNYPEILKKLEDLRVAADIGKADV